MIEESERILKADLTEKGNVGFEVKYCGSQKGVDHFILKDKKVNRHFKAKADVYPDGYIKYSKPI